MSPPPRLSVVIPTWNRRDLVVGAAVTTLSLGAPVHEVVVVDDGSDDGTVGALEAVDDARLHVLRRPHEGVGSARNAGARAATGDWLLFLDSDDRLLADGLAALGPALGATDADVVIGGWTTVTPDGRSSTWVPPPPGAGVDVDHLAPRWLAGAAAVRRGTFLAVGGYDPALRYGENTELALRLLTRRSAPDPALVRRPVVRITGRPGPIPDPAPRVHSARVVLGRYRAERRRLPHLWASYHALVGVDAARHAQRARALVHLAAAWASDPLRPEHLARLGTALVPPLARRVWPPEADRGAPAVLAVSLAPGVGGSVRSLGTVLAHLDGVTRIVGRPAGSSSARFLAERHLADEVVELPVGATTRPRLLVERMTAVLALCRVAARRRGALAAVHANGLADLNLAVLPARIAGCPVVVWVHEWEVSPWSRRLWPALRRLAPEVRLVAVSDQTRALLVGAGLAAAADVAVVANPVDPADVVPDRRRPAEPGVLRVAYLGTPAVYKGFDLLPAVVAATRDLPVRWQVFAGPESMMPATFTRLRDLGVDLPGKVLDVRCAYAGADAVVVPSRHESFGRVVVEAMANGLPVVASDLAPVRALLGDDAAGLLVPPGDVAAVAAALARLAADPALARCLGAEGRRRAAGFAPGPVVAALAGLYGTAARSEVLDVGPPEAVAGVEHER